jgi:integrase
VRYVPVGCAYGKEEEKMRGKLTQADISLLGPGFHHDGDGLYLQVHGPRSRSWIYRYGVKGKQRWLGLGSARDVTLASARKARDKARAQVRSDKIDIVAERHRERQIASATSMTFRKASEAFIAAQEHNWRSNKHSAQWRASLATHAYSYLGEMPVATITRADVIRVLEPIWLKKPETARRVRGRIQSILDWTIARGDRPEGENPASRGPLVRGLPKQPTNGRSHYAAMPYSEVPAFLKVLRSREGMAALALEFAILTAARTNEVLRACWNEIDRVDGTWTVPASRMKVNRPHRVPLTDAAFSVLDRAQQQGELIFPGAKGRPLSNASMLKVLGRMGKGDVTTHGFRAAFRTWISEETDFPRDLAEAALAHVVSDKTEAAYQRGTLFGKRRRLMEAWAAYVG